MELQALPFVRSSHTVTRTEKVPRPTPPTFNEANTGLDAAVCSRGALSDSEPARRSMFASAAQCPWSTGVRASRAVPRCSSSGVDRGVPRSEGPLSLQVLPRPSQLRSRGGKARLRKRAFEGTPVIVDHLAQLRRKEQGFSTGYFGAPHEESCGYDDPNIATATERDFQMVPSSPSLKRLCSSAERGWQKQHTHAPPNSVLEPSAHELPLEDTPSQFQDNWAFFSAPQAAGINWKSSDSFLGSSEEEGRVQKLNGDTGCDPVMFGLQEGTPPLTSSEGEGLASWEHHGLSLLPASLDAVPTSNLNEGEDTVQQQSHDTNQAPFWLRDYGAGNEDGSDHAGMDRSRSIGRPTDPRLCGVPSVPADEEDDHHSSTSSSDTRQHRHFGCNQEESPLIPWEE